MTVPRENGPIVKEIILENFMSYRYARIPLDAGLNLICGPNGSGKSSILLALAVALGQTYTERSRRLSDLIRRGEDIARVSVVFDNKERNGTKPIPRVRSDELLLSRYLKKDGTYWCEADFRTVSKVEVESMLSRMGIDPDNMLIVMHQNMIENFSIVDAKEKLRMVEDAVGMGEYRDRIVDARQKLEHVLSEKEAADQMLERAQETLEYWSDRYERYLRKVELEENREILEREYAWARFTRHEEQIRGLEEELTEIRHRIEDLNKEIKTAEEEIDLNKHQLRRTHDSLDDTFSEVIVLSREASRLETEIEHLEKKSTHQESGDETQVQLQILSEKLGTVEDEIDKARTEITKLKTRRESVLEEFVDARVRAAVLRLRKELAQKDATDLRRQLRSSRSELAEIRAEAEAKGERIESHRNLGDILDEIRMTKARLEGLSDVSSDVERMYDSYREEMETLQERAKIASKNRRRALEELHVREQVWRKRISDLLGDLRVAYQKMLDGFDATGDVRLANSEDIDEAGLEILVGFRGSEPSVLDAYVQSGGERTTAVMCLLLALQRHVKSPIRAVDEFDVHMDPRNREVVMDHLAKSFQGDSTQYLVITPGQLSNLDHDSHVIVVQNVLGSSRVDVVG